ncbi:ABC transporter ATP-binding protein [Zongyangia hominis]|uniref:ABC transporter ATP-binding protein n=1 Tax=Zongyangia hominis TaxID=2763677 RepID=A0A926I9N4_9FIRM|nr:ABC transporter ATP-binding protein [Zongyangia hominis]MBC8569341.1 ABC transporter ATP-binding protein [Zongyangia hominis]
MTKLLRYLRPFTKGIVLVVLLTFVSGFADLSLPALMSNIIDKGVATGNTGYIFTMGALMLALALLGMAATIVVGYFAARISTGLGRDLRKGIFRKVEEFALAEFDTFGTSSLITRTTNDVQQLQMFLMMLLRVVIMAPILCVGGIIMTLAKSASLSLVVVVAVPFLIFMVMMIANRALPLSKSMQRKLDRVNMVMREKLTGIRVIKAFNNTEYEKGRFDEANKDLTQTTVKMQRTMALLMPAVMVILNFSTIGLMWFGGLRIQAGAMMVGDVMAVVQYVMQIMMSFVMMSMVFVMMPRASASAERIMEVIDSQITVTDPEQPRRAPEDVKGSVEFRHVTFSYPGAPEPVIKDISFATAKGETTAIIGSTGSGKSTIIKLIPRLYDVTEGEVLVDGINVRDYAQKDLRAKIGYIPQKAVLFSGTIRSNILSGKEDATEEDMRAAAILSQSMEFIEQKEEQFDSPIAQGGTNVSGGQKQRLSIARAAVREPEIYIFDDSFSALDFKTDAALRAALKKKTQDAAVIIVAQRISTIMDADRILVMDEGQLIGVGTHRELLNTCEIYREIASSQLTAEELA